MNFEGEFTMPLNAGEGTPVEPYPLDINLMGANANIATIKTEIVKAEGEELVANITITKGTALSDEFWEANYEKIGDFVRTSLLRIRKK